MFAGLITRLYCVSSRQGGKLAPRRPRAARILLVSQRSWLIFVGGVRDGWLRRKKEPRYGLILRLTQRQGRCLPTKPNDGKLTPSI